MTQAELMDERRGLLLRLAEVQEAIRAAGHDLEPIILHPGEGGVGKAEAHRSPHTGRWVAKVTEGSITQILGVYDTLSEANGASDRWNREAGR